MGMGMKKVLRMFKFLAPICYGEKGRGKMDDAMQECLSRERVQVPVETFCWLSSASSKRGKS